MLVDGPDDVRISVEAFPIILPKVPRGQQQAAMFREKVPELPEAWQQVCHLQTHFLQAPAPSTAQDTRQETCGICLQGSAWTSGDQAIDGLLGSTRGWLTSRGPQGKEFCEQNFGQLSGERGQDDN